MSPASRAARAPRPAPRVRAEDVASAATFLAEDLLNDDDARTADELDRRDDARATVFSLVGGVLEAMGMVAMSAELAELAERIRP